MVSIGDKRSSVLITGYSPSGIGKALAQEFHQRGLRMFATARDTGALQSLVALGIETLSLVVDDERSVQSCYAEVRERLGEKGLDYLVSNTNGSYIIDYTVPAMEVDLAEARATFETNLFAVINMCQTFLPLLKKAQGTIIQIGSVAGVIPYVFGSVYNASKVALHSFSDTLRVELVPSGSVNVTTIVTGGVQSRIAHVKRTLAPNSLYAPIEDESVVTQILYGTTSWRWLWPWAKGRKSWISEGNKSWLTWFLSRGWAWTGIFHHAMTRMFKLYKLKKMGGK
ncbi:short chain dehydrogenase/reductase [Aspergillus sergii]|uniref:Short chain dehydrogenase/reductase n=1 Tax=Aspergillus sergii TaxID=1034303 RepID=A0A5N6WYR5_9EURO|nr:short chain dehydrogenase/reductase [Aspergillus sergii]